MFLNICKIFFPFFWICVTFFVGQVYYNVLHVIFKYCAKNGKGYSHETIRLKTDMFQVSDWANASLFLSDDNVRIGVIIYNLLI